MKEQELKVYEGEVRNAYIYQSTTTPEWTFYNEREHTETTFHNRFNFLLLVYSLFVNAYFMSNNNIDRLTILIIGFIIVTLLSIGIFRAYTRFRILMDILHSLDERSASNIALKKYKKKPIFKIFPINDIYGYIVPIVIVSSFVAGLVLNLFFK
jgi:hypothetical protein